VIEEAMEDITATVVETDGEPAGMITEFKFDIEMTPGTEPEEDFEVEALKDTVDELNDTVENLRAQLDQLVAQNAEKKEIEDEDSDDLSEVIDLTFDSHEVKSEIDLALLDLDVGAEDLHSIITDALERELMNRTGKLPKEV
jgi:predicted RNase H-like nuclease (RuvC/YqgF family)